MTAGSAGAPPPRLPDDLAATYEPVRLLGSGASGHVWLASQTALDRQVVLKVLRALEPDAVARFRREAEVLARLDHPSVPRLLDYGATEQYAYLTSAYAPGVSVQSWLDERKRLPWREACAAMEQVFDALSHVHAAGILHRDVKPANILRLADGRLLLIDFGLALGSHHTRLTEAASLVGSPAYMCPAQLTEGLTDPRCDLYATGVTLYQMLSGVRPFRATSLKELFRIKLTSELPPLPPADPPVPAPLEVLLRALVARDLEARPRSANEVVAQLVALRSPASAPPRSRARVEERRPGQARTGSRRRALRPVLAVGVILAALSWVTHAARRRPQVIGSPPPAPGRALPLPEPLKRLAFRLRSDGRVMEARFSTGVPRSARLATGDGASSAWPSAPTTQHKIEMPATAGPTTFRIELLSPGDTVRASAWFEGSLAAALASAVTHTRGGDWCAPLSLALGAETRVTGLRELAPYLASQDPVSARARFAVAPLRCLSRTVAGLEAIGFACAVRGITLPAEVAEVRELPGARDETPEILASVPVVERSIGLALTGLSTDQRAGLGSSAPALLAAATAVGRDGFLERSPEHEVEVVLPRVPAAGALYLEACMTSTVPAACVRVLVSPAAPAAHGISCEVVLVPDPASPSASRRIIRALSPVLLDHPRVFVRMRLEVLPPANFGKTTLSAVKLIVGPAAP